MANSKKKFRTFEAYATHPMRALQAWQILISAAKNRQIHSYLSLSKLMYGKSAAGVLGQVLGHVAFYCKDSRLPPLTVIVVGQKRGTPGALIPVKPEDQDVEREKVFKHDWYNVIPPTPGELKAAFDLPRDQLKRSPQVERRA